MELTDNDVVALGTFAEALLRDDNFATILRHYEYQSFHAFCGTKPADKQTREHLYAELQGVGSFIGSMADLVKRKNEIINPEPSSEEEDDVLDIEID